MLVRTLRGLALCCAFVLCASANAACPPAGHTADSLQALKARDFELSNAETRNQLAVALADCLGHSDPQLRDGVAFEGLAAWMRKGQLETATLRELHARLVPMLKAEDPQGFRRPFASLVLSEVVRTDRIQPWMTVDERARLVEAAAAYLERITDYRGFIDGEGWRHGVAHTADLALQLALLPQLDLGQLNRLREAIAKQVAPAGKHAYIHGEPLRLARAVFYTAKRGLHDAIDWEAWLARVSASSPLTSWNDAFSSEAGLAKRHNTAAFLSMLYLIAQEQDDAETRDRLLPGLRAAVKNVP